MATLDGSASTPEESLMSNNPVDDQMSENGVYYAKQKIVSFRSDVALAPRSADAVAAVALSGHSSIASTDSGSHHKYSKLRSNLTRENKRNRDPFYFYQVVRNLGSGSMGDVKLVKKRQDRIGGSARRDLQQALKRQQREKECMELPVVGGLFQLCLDGDLKDDSDDSGGWSSHHSLFSVLSLSSSKDNQLMNRARSFEDSLLQSKDKLSEMIYAMKSIILDQVEQQVFRDELRNEIAILKDLDHPNIVRAIETFEFKGEISIVMEVCSGGDLYARDPYTELEAARITTCIVQAIAYMHSCQVVHRDLKFENILFVNTSPMAQVKLIDFGLSKVYHQGYKLTDISGTIYTMAPEVLKGQHSEQADMWSIGVMAYMLLASALPFFGKTRQDVVNKILRNKYSFKGKRWKTLSKEAHDFVAQLLVMDPDRRATAQDALASSWLTGPIGQAISRGVFPEEESLAKSAILRYSQFPKLKKMALMVVAHKSSVNEIGVLRKLFEMYASSDGSIQFDDFEAVFTKDRAIEDVDEQELRSIFDAMDLDGTGKIRYTEFVAATIEAHGRISEARLAEAFDRLDSDDSGFITAQDLREILGEEVETEEMEQIIAQVHVGDDIEKGVSYSEFMGLWENEERQVMEKTLETRKIIEREMSTISVDDTEASEGGDDYAHAEFLKEKHLQNTLHTWALEMQLPAQEFAKGCSFLHQVALGNQSDVEKILEEWPALANFRDYDRRTALHIAASEGQLKTCQFLIQKGARVNRSDRWGGFPMDDAHRHRRNDVMDLLRMHGAKFGSTSLSANLISAASEGNVSEVRTLLEFGSMDLNQGDYDHRTALHLAANNGHLEVVGLLLKAGADKTVFDRFGAQPLDDARKAKKNSTAIVSILSSDQCLDVEITPSAGADPLGQQPAAKMHDLKDPSAKQATASLALPEEKLNEEGMTELGVLEFAMGCSLLHQAALGNQLVLEMILLEQPPLVNFRDYDRRTALHIAASEGNLETCQFLVKRGAKINRVDRWGGSPLDDAHRHKHIDVVEFLRDEGAKFGSTSQITNFITAASEGDVDEVKAFLEFGSVDLNQGDYDRRTALHLAAGEGHLEIVKMLCRNGANVNIEDRWGNRPLDEAKKSKSNSSDVMKVLLQHGARSTNLFTTFATTVLIFFSASLRKPS